MVNSIISFSRKRRFCGPRREIVNLLAFQATAKVANCLLEATAEIVRAIRQIITKTLTRAEGRQLLLDNKISPLCFWSLDLDSRWRNV